MRCNIFTCFLLLLSILSNLSDGFAQTAPGKYWVRFTDKENSPYSLSQPEAFLSPKCVERRIAQGIVFDVLDLPVNPSYIDQVLAIGPGILHHR
ncbi:MAG: hypothetical protein ACKO7B_06750, partial [Flavobacteriales bacterium]